MYEDSLLYSKKPLPRTQPGYRDLESFPRTKLAYYDENYINTRKQNVIDANNRRTQKFRSTSYYPPKSTYQGEDPDPVNKMYRREKVRELLERSKQRPRFAPNNGGALNDESSVDEDGNRSRQLENEPLSRKGNGKKMLSMNGKRNLRLNQKDSLGSTGSMLDGKYSRDGELVDYPENGYVADPSGGLEDNVNWDASRGQRIMKRPVDAVGRMAN